MSNRNSKRKEFTVSGKSDCEKYFLHYKTYMQLFGNRHGSQALNSSLFLGQVLISTKWYLTMEAFSSGPNHLVLNHAAHQFVESNCFPFTDLWIRIYFYLKLVYAPLHFLHLRHCLFVSSITRCKRKEHSVFSIPQVCYSARFSIRQIDWF